jgi:serine/threonine-protein kinase
MGTVFDALQVSTGRRVAIKVVHLDDFRDRDSTLARFQREARAAGAIDSKHIASVLDAGLDEGTGHAYLVMELLKGQDLQQLLRQAQRLPCDLALRIAAQACTGLVKAHQVGVIHRDIKPANLFVARRDGDECVVKLLDFGIAKLQFQILQDIDRADLTQTGSVLGSPLYMSPEQARGTKHVDERTDIWSLGVVLYQLVTGITPFARCESLGTLILSICTEPIRPLRDVLPGVAPELDALLERALAKDSRDRFRSAAEMLSAMEDLLREGSELTETMFAAYVDGSSRGEASAPIPLASSPAVASVAADGGSTTTIATALASGRSLRTPARTSRVGRLAIGSFVVLAGIGGFYARSRLSDHRAAISSPPAMESLPRVPVAASAAPVGEPSASTRVVDLAISPVGASVEIDGAPAVNDAGHTKVRGFLGSVHHVRVASGGSAIDADVVIAQTGALPAALTLPTKTPPSHSASATARGNVASPVTRPAGPSQTASAAGSVTPQGIDREFR